MKKELKQLFFHQGKDAREHARSKG